MSAATRPRIGYVISHYPYISHTFIQREVLGLRDAGFDVETISVIGTGDEHVLSPTDRIEAERTMDVRPVGVRRAWRHLVRPAAAHPAAVVAMLRTAANRWWTDPKPLLWRVFYVAEALLVWSLARERGIDHLHAHHANSASNLAWLASEYGRRVGDGPVSWSFTLHGSSEFVDVERVDLGPKAEAAAGVACISDFTRSQLMMVSSPDVWDRFEVVHCGVDPDLYHPPALPRRPDRQDPFTVLFVGRLGAEKGVTVLVEATAELARRLAPRPVRLLVVGEGDQRDRIEASSRRHGLDTVITGAVGQHQMLALYHQADAFCLTSFREGIPVVLMEAMACEVPCVAPRITALPELIDDGVSGLLATAGRSDHIAEALEQLATDPVRARAIGRAGRERVLADFTTDQTVAGMVKFFDRLFEPT